MSEHRFDNEVDGLNYCSRCGWWQGAAPRICEPRDGVVNVRREDGRIVAARLVTTTPVQNGVSQGCGRGSLRPTKHGPGNTGDDLCPSCLERDRAAARRRMKAPAQRRERLVTLPV